jgi:hypothetical protein
MKAANEQLWVIFAVAFDDTAADSADASVEPYVGKELIDSVEDAAFTAFLRGGTILTCFRGDERTAEATRDAIEAEVLRRR